MEITLRRADAVFKAAVEKAKAGIRPGKEELSIFDQRPAADQMAAARQKTLDLFREGHELLGAAFVVRELTGRRNAEVGIDGLLRRRKLVDLQEQMLVTFLAARDRHAVIPSAAVVQAEIEGLRAQQTKERAYGHREAATADVLTADDVESAHRQLDALRLRKREMDGELIRLNMDTRIDIPDPETAILRRNSLL